MSTGDAPTKPKRPDGSQLIAPAAEPAREARAGSIGPQRGPAQAEVGGPKPALGRWLDKLNTQKDLETAGRTLLALLLTELRVAGQRLAPDVRGLSPLRGMLHLRKGEATLGLVVTEAGGEGPEGPHPLSPSTSAWRRVGETGRAVVLSVQAEPPPAGPFSNRPAALSEPTAIVLRGRGVSLEVHCAVAGGEQAWKALLDHLSPLVASTTPLVLGLPRRPAAIPEQDPLLPVVGAALRPTLEVLRRFARHPDTILLLGETGTGKSRLARWCHALSPRESRPFEVVHVHAIPESLLEGELFGWKKGAHSGASHDRTGIVGRAEGGTLFIDEIHRLPATVQEKLLWLLDERRYRVLGEEGPPREANIRLIAASSTDLRELVAEGRFLRDLYYRISALPVVLPPLRERGDELPAWAQFMAARKQIEAGEAGETRFGEDALALLHAQGWPGNLRELDQVVRRAWILAWTAQGRGVEIDGPAVAAALGLENGRKLPTGAETGGTLPTLRPGSPADNSQQVGRAPTQAGPNETLMGALERAAQAWVAEAVRRKAAGLPPLPPLDEGQAFKAAVWLAAVGACGDKEGMRLVGQERQVEQRNHLRSLARERERWEAFRKSLLED